MQPPTKQAEPGWTLVLMEIQQPAFSLLWWDSNHLIDNLMDFIPLHKACVMMIWQGKSLYMQLAFNILWSLSIMSMNISFENCQIYGYSTNKCIAFMIEICIITSCINLQCTFVVIYFLSSTFAWTLLTDTSVIMAYICYLFWGRTSCYSNIYLRVAATLL